MTSALDFLKTRASNPVLGLAEPGPDGATLAEMLTIAARVPDHGKLVPWRFIVYRGDARAEAGRRLEALAASRNPDIRDAQREEEQRRFTRAPVVVGVVSRAAEHPKIPVWEQQLSAAAAAFNLTLAAKTLGFGAQWRTEWVAYDDDAKAVLGIAQEERVAGFVFIGTPTMPTPERPRPDLADIVTEWQP